MHVVIVGGGVFGCCAALELARSGASVTLIERDAFGAHASGRNPGNLNPILGAAQELVPFALASFRLHQVLASELAAGARAPYALEPVKRVLLAFDAMDQDELGEVEQAFAEHPGFATTRLRAAALRGIEARLSAAAREGLLIEGNCSLDSEAYHRAIAAAARGAGADIIRASATGIAAQDGTVSGVQTTSGAYTCDAVVLATGPWVAETAAWIGVEVPVAPVKGEMLRLRLADRNVTHDFTHGLISLYRRGDDEVWVGVTREHAGFDESTTEEGRRTLIDGAARIMPAIRDAEVIEHLAALRPMTRSALPIVGRAAGWNNIYIANGGGIKGILLSTGVGAAIRDLVVNGRTSLPLPEAARQGAS